MKTSHFSVNLNYKHVAISDIGQSFTWSNIKINPLNCFLISIFSLSFIFYNIVLFPHNFSHLKMNEPKKDLDLPQQLLNEFSIKVEVFGTTILATRGVSKEKIMHAAKVMAGYIDSNDDGIPNNIDVAHALKKCILIITKNEKETDRIMTKMENIWLFNQFEIPYIQDLSSDEMVISNGRNGKFDASLEEILHLVTQGYFSVFPTLKRSVLKSMDNARGGQFKTVPNKYPYGSWYTYYDKTCDYEECMSTEYFYWGLTSLLGAQKFDGRLDDIIDEWQLNTPSKLKKGDPMLYSILTDKRYQLPNTLPNDKYQSKKFKIMHLKKKKEVGG